MKKVRLWARVLFKFRLPNEVRGVNYMVKIVHYLMCNSRKVFLFGKKSLNHTSVRLLPSET